MVFWFYEKWKGLFTSFFYIWLRTTRSQKMKYTVLPNTDLKVSEICLGTMTFGQQNTKEDGFEQLSYAVDHGVNFIDTAELYPVPAKAETYGGTEAIIGEWLKETGRRDEVVLATKICGPGAYTAHIRGNGFAPEAIEEAIEGSLKRLQTDYIDLYQLHWPTRPVNCFGVRAYPHDNFMTEREDNFLQVLESLNKLVKAGKIGHFGLSNETPWGIMKYMRSAEDNGLIKPVTLQNSYSMIHRSFEIGLSETCMEEKIGLLAYSPLAFGVLSGKYLDAQPADARVTLFPNYNRYSSEQAAVAVRKYKAVAEKYGMSLTEMSLAFVNHMPFVTSNIIGASKLSQLKENINSINIKLTPEIMEEINAIQKIHPDPAP